MPSVVVIHDLPLADHLVDRRHDLAVLNARNHREAHQLLQKADILFCNTYGWDDSYLDVLKADSWVQVTSAGIHSYPIEALDAQGVTFSAASRVTSHIVAEHAMALALALTRCLPAFLELQSNHHWASRDGITRQLLDLKDRTMTVYGLGEIGELVAERGLAFGMELNGIKRDPATYSGCLRSGSVHGSDSLRELLEETDLLVISVPLTEATRHSIDHDVFRQLPSTALVVNVARGAVLDESALVKAIEFGEIAGAGLDVFVDEPLPPDSPLWDMDDVIITPHIAGRSDSFMARSAQMFLENYDRRMNGLPLQNQII